MREIEMFLLMNMDSPLSRDRCMKLIQKNVNERVVEELERMATKIGMEVSERIGDLQNKQIMQIATEDINFVLNIIILLFINFMIAKNIKEKFGE